MAEYFSYFTECWNYALLPINLQDWTILNSYLDQGVYSGVEPRNTHLKSATTDQLPVNHQTIININSPVILCVNASERGRTNLMGNTGWHSCQENLRYGM